MRISCMRLIETIAYFILGQHLWCSLCIASTQRLRSLISYIGSYANLYDTKLAFFFFAIY